MAEETKEVEAKEETKEIEVPEKFKKLVDEIEKMKVLDLAEHVKILEEKFRDLRQTLKGIKESKDLVDAAASAHQMIKENAKKEEAEEIKKQFEAAGATVELK